MSGIGLEQLTNELFEYIVRKLDLQDVKNLRLVSRDIDHKTKQQTFRSFYKASRVDLTQPQLEKFNLATSPHGSLNAVIEDLTLVNIVYHPEVLQEIVRTKTHRVSFNGDGHDWVDCTEDELTQAADDLARLELTRAAHTENCEEGLYVSLLRGIFSNLAMNSRHGLKTLTLQMMLQQRPNNTARLYSVEAEIRYWNKHFLLEAAAQTFDITISALRDSALSLQSFDIFNTSPAALCYALPCSSLSRYDWNTEAYGSSLKSIKALSLSVCDHVVKANDVHQVEQANIDDARRRYLANEANFSGVANLLAGCTCLEDLNLSEYRVYIGTTNASLENEIHMRTMKSLVNHKFPRIQSLRVAGSTVDATDLAAFVSIQGATMRRLTLEEIRIKTGRLSRIAQDIREKCPALEFLTLADISGEGRLVHFDGERSRPYTMISGVHNGRNAIQREKEDVHKELAYYKYRGRTVGTPRVAAWDRRRGNEFGGRRS